MKCKCVQICSCASPLTLKACLLELVHAGFCSMTREYDLKYIPHRACSRLLKCITFEVWYTKQDRWNVHLHAFIDVDTH